MDWAARSGDARKVPIVRTVIALASTAKAPPSITNAQMNPRTIRIFRNICSPPDGCGAKTSAPIYTSSRSPTILGNRLESPRKKIMSGRYIQRARLQALRRDHPKKACFSRSISLTLFGPHTEDGPVAPSRHRKCRIEAGCAPSIRWLRHLLGMTADCSALLGMTEYCFAIYSG